MLRADVVLFDLPRVVVLFVETHALRRLRAVEVKGIGVGVGEPVPVGQYGFDLGFARVGRRERADGDVDGLARLGLVEHPSHRVRLLVEVGELARHVGVRGELAVKVVVVQLRLLALSALRFLLLAAPVLVVAAEELFAWLRHELEAPVPAPYVHVVVLEEEVEVDRGERERHRLHGLFDVLVIAVERGALHLDGRDVAGLEAKGGRKPLHVEGIGCVWGIAPLEALRVADGVGELAPHLRGEHRVVVHRDSRPSHLSRPVWANVRVAAPVGGADFGVLFEREHGKHLAKAVLPEPVFVVGQSVGTDGHLPRPAVQGLEGLRHYHHVPQSVVDLLGRGLVTHGAVFLVVDLSFGDAVAELFPQRLHREGEKLVGIPHGEGVFA